MAPHPAVIAAQKAALDKAKGKTAADNRQEIKDQAAAALAKLGLSTPSPRNSGYDGSLNEPGATPPSSSITERIARLRRSLSDEKAADDAAPVTPDEEDSPAFTDEEEDAREKPAEPEEG